MTNTSLYTVNLLQHIILSYWLTKMALLIMICSHNGKYPQWMGRILSAKLRTRLPMNWRRKGPGHQQPWYWHNIYPRTFPPQHQECSIFLFVHFCVRKCVSPYAVLHYNDVIMGAITSQITSLTIVYSIVYSDADQRKHQSAVSLAFVRGTHRGPVNSPHKRPVTGKMLPFNDVIMCS